MIDTYSYYNDDPNSQYILFCVKSLCVVFTNNIIKDAKLYNYVRRAVRSMPPKSRSQRKAVTSTAATLDPCCICKQKIGPKNEVLFCSGNCQKYRHRYCASVSESSYKSLTSEGAPPFLCFCCYRAQKDDQLIGLLSEIQKRRAEINVLKSGAAVSPPSVPSYAKAAMTQRSPTTSAATTASGESCAKPVSRQYHQDSKFNAILYGVQERPLGMSKSARFESGSLCLCQCTPQ